METKVFKDYNLRLDIEDTKMVEVDSVTKTKIVFYQRDAVKINIDIVQNKAPKVLDGIDINLVCKRPNLSISVRQKDDIVKTDESGTIEIFLENKMVSIVGLHSCQLELIGTNGVIHTQMFQYEVLECLGGHEEENIAICDEGTVIGDELICGNGSSEEIYLKENIPSALHEDFLKLRMEV